RTAPPMKQVHIEVIRVQPLQACVARTKRALVRSGRWHHFTYKENVRATSANRIANDLLRARVHFGSIDVGHTQLQPNMQRVETILSDLPGALSDDRNLHTCSAKFASEHE